jgi:hypothetical protein
VFGGGLFDRVQSLTLEREVYLMPANEAAVFAAITSLAAERGEPWLTRLRRTELRSRLTAPGFSQVTHLSPQTANERYFRGRSDDLQIASRESVGTGQPTVVCPKCGSQRGPPSGLARSKLGESQDLKPGGSATVRSPVPTRCAHRHYTRAVCAHPRRMPESTDLVAEGSGFEL